jgi:hypothetical protein
LKYLLYFIAVFWEKSQRPVNGIMKKLMINPALLINTCLDLAIKPREKTPLKKS